MAALLMLLAASPAMAQRHADRGEVSPTVAGLLSGGFTLLPVAAAGPLAVTDHAWSAFTALALGICVGPSVGYFYAGEVGDGLVRLLRRSLIFGGAVGLFELGRSLPVPGLGYGVVISSFAVGIVAFAFAIWDTAGAEAAAQRANRRRALGRIALAPLLGVDRTAPRGLTLQVTF